MQQSHQRCPLSPHNHGPQRNPLSQAEGHFAISRPSLRRVDPRIQATAPDLRRIRRQVLEEAEMAVGQDVSRAAAIEILIIAVYLRSSATERISSSHPPAGRIKPDQYRPIGGQTDLPQVLLNVPANGAGRRCSTEHRVETDASPRRGPTGRGRCGPAWRVAPFAYLLLSVIKVKVQAGGAWV